MSVEGARVAMSQDDARRVRKSGRPSLWFRLIEWRSFCVVCGRAWLARADVVVAQSVLPEEEEAQITSHVHLRPWQLEWRLNGLRRARQLFSHSTRLGQARSLAATLIGPRAVLAQSAYLVGDPIAQREQIKERRSQRGALLFSHLITSD